MVSIIAFQAIGRGSIPRRRKVETSMQRPDLFAFCAADSYFCFLAGYPPQLLSLAAHRPRPFCADFVMLFGHLFTSVQPGILMLSLFAFSQNWRQQCIACCCLSSHCTVAVHFRELLQQIMDRQFTLESSVCSEVQLDSSSHSGHLLLQVSLPPSHKRSSCCQSPSRHSPGGGTVE